MATKDYSRMTTKKLNKLMEIATAEEQALIQAELDKRAQVEAKEAAAAAELSAEEQAAVNGEASQAEASQAEASQAKAEKQKMTNEERTALAEKLRAEIVGHKCQVVPFNTPEWVPGVIVGIVEEKRSNKVLCAIKTDEGKRIVKVFGSPCLKILEETADIVKERRTRTAAKVATLTEGGDWDMEADIAKYIGNVGKIIKFIPFGGTGEDMPEAVGRIMALVPDKRVNRILYRIQMSAPVEGNAEATKTVHKVASSSGFEIAEEFDEAGAQINAAYIERREKAATRVPATPEARVELCKAAVAKAEEALEKAKANLEAKKAELEKAQKELEASVVGDERPEAAQEASDDLM